MGRYDELFEGARADGFEIEFHGPSSKEQIHHLAAALGVELPPSYVQFLREYGGGGMTTAPFSGIIRGNPLLQNRGSIYGDTIYHREQWGMPKEFVVIYYDEESTWCLDTRTRRADGECPVVNVGVSRSHSIQRIADSFDDLIRGYLGAAGGA